MALVNAATVIAELGDLTRFANPRQRMADLGLVPCEHSAVRASLLTIACGSVDKLVEIKSFGAAALQRFCRRPAIC